MAKQKKNQLASKEASWLSPQKMEALVAECNKLYQTKGLLKAEDLVSVASDEGHALHDVFEWNDTIAADRWRNQQARSLIHLVKVEVTSGDQVAHYVNVKMEDDQGNVDRGYVPLNFAMKEQSLREQILSSALREIRYWENKYKDYQDLAGIVNEEKVSKLEEQVSN